MLISEICWAMLYFEFVSDYVLVVNSDSQFGVQKNINSLI